MKILKKLVINGFNEFIKHKKLSFASATIIALTLVLFGIAGGMESFIYAIALLFLVGCPFLILWGIIAKIIDFPSKLKREKYKDLFEKIGFVSVNNLYPIFLGETTTPYFRIMTFNSLIPLRDWENKKSLIETFLNVQIKEIANAKNSTNIVNLYIIIKELPHSLPFETHYMTSNDSTLIVGTGYDGSIQFDLNKNAHTFVAGETGSGKSNILKGLIYQCLHKRHEVILIDFKRGVSFAMFEQYIDIYSEHESIKTILAKLVNTTISRYDMFKNQQVENINEYNKRNPSNKLNRIVVFIDELAELIKTSDKKMTSDIVNSLETLTRLSRAAGINLIMGIQRPDSTIINGQIKNNVTYRICGRFVDREPSRIMLANDMATSLPNIKGRFIVKDSSLTEFQAYYFTRESMPLGKLIPKPQTRAAGSAIESSREPVETQDYNQQVANKERPPSSFKATQKASSETKASLEPTKIIESIQDIDFNFESIDL